MLQNFVDCVFAYSWYGLQTQAENILNLELAGLPIRTCHLLQRPQTSQRVLSPQLLLQLLSHKADQLSRLSNVVDSNNFEAVLDPCFEDCAFDLPLTLGKASGKMPFEQIDHIAESTIFESILLLLVPAIVYGADEVVGLFALDNVVHNLSFVVPHKIAEG